MRIFTDLSHRLSVLSVNNLVYTWKPSCSVQEYPQEVQHKSDKQNWTTPNWKLAALQMSGSCSKQVSEQSHTHCCSHSSPLSWTNNKLEVAKETQRGDEVEVNEKLNMQLCFLTYETSCSVPPSRLCHPIRIQLFPTNLLVWLWCSCLPVLENKLLSNKAGLFPDLASEISLINEAN